MDRRTFILLTGAASAALWRPARRPFSPSSAAGSLRFDLDDQRRLSLFYHGDAPEPIPLLRNAALGVWIGDSLTTLADLEDVSVGNRRPPGGESLAIRGRSRGVWVEAEFVAWEAGPVPGAHGAITITVHPDRVLATIRGIRVFATSEPEVLPAAPGSAPPLEALTNGYQSSSGCNVIVLPDTATSFGAVGLTRGMHSLGVIVDPGEPGEARVAMTPNGTLEAVSDWVPPRPVRPEGDAVTLRLTYLPGLDGAAALSAAATPPSALDRERMAGLAVPTGWCSWYELGAAVTEADVLANLEYCATHFDPRFFRYVQLDDGYQRAVGDWEMNDKFPHGHRWLTDRIHAAHFQAGLWVAPFAVAEQAEVARANPVWLLKDAVTDPRAGWSGRTVALDPAHPGVQQWLYDLARRIVRDWGYDYLKIDFLHLATAGATHHGGLTHAEAYRRGLAAIRDGVGTEAFLLGCGAPLQHAAGIVDGMRIGADVDASWEGIQEPARATALRSFYHRTAWLNDPDCLVLRPPLTLDEARVWASIVAVSGGVTMFSDNLTTLPADRLPLLQKTIPVPATAGPARAMGAAKQADDIAPGLSVAGTVVPLRGPWRFRTGDDARYAARDYDDDTWETIVVPGTWETAGHPDYDGRAWYRTRFTLPALGDRAPAEPVYLELGKVDDNDETFINGIRIGGTTGRRSYRRYRVPAGTLNAVGDNVLAIRVTDAAGHGGLWRIKRDRPPQSWLVEGAPGWWTVAFVNWDDEPMAIEQRIGALGIQGDRFNAYDVWAERPLPDLQQKLQGTTVAPHSTLTLALRAAGPRPQVIGTTRHVVQGAVDIRDERWDPATRTLAATSVNLDGRPYAVTIAVPRGLRARTCTADKPCTLSTRESGHIVLDWPARVLTDVNWSVTFSSAVRRGRGS